MVALLTLAELSGAFDCLLLLGGWFGFLLPACHMTTLFLQGLALIDAVTVGIAD